MFVFIRTNKECQQDIDWCVLFQTRKSEKKTTRWMLFDSYRIVKCEFECVLWKWHVPSFVLSLLFLPFAVIQSGWLSVFIDINIQNKFDGPQIYRQSDKLDMFYLIWRTGRNFPSQEWMKNRKPSKYTDLPNDFQVSLKILRIVLKFEYCSRWQAMNTKYSFSLLVLCSHFFFSLLSFTFFSWHIYGQIHAISSI